MTITLSPAAVEDAPRTEVPRPDRPAAPASRHGRADGSPRWVRPALVLLLVSTGVLYLWGLGAEGWANSFYSAAVEAGTKSWKAFFFGSFDSSNFITVDKPPASLWVMEISARLFGLNAWSILVPQALEGVATVGVLYATVKRWFGPISGLLAGAVVALTPVAALMFRYNNPDALLVLLLTAAAYATTRAIETGRTRWLVLAMSLVGTGFLTKMLQAFLVVPALALVYLIAGPPKLGRRIGQLALAGVALLVSSGWWVVTVELIPARDRPYVGGSQDDNLFNLIFGYNGLGRLSGNEVGSALSGSAASPWGSTGWDRLFLPSFGSQISWLIPAALILMVATLWSTRRAARSDITRAATLLFGGWLLVTGLVLSYAKGIIHPYYTIALAPAIAALVAIGATVQWRNRSHVVARLSLAGALAATSIWAFVLLERSSSWMPGLRTVVLVGGLATALALAVAPLRHSVAAATLPAAAIALALLAPAAYTLDTAVVVHSGAIPSAGPTQAGSTSGPGGTAPGGGGQQAGGFGTRGSGAGSQLPGGAPGGAGSALGGRPPSLAGGSGSAGRSSTVGTATGPGTGPSGQTGAAGGANGSLLQSGTPGKALTALLETDAGGYRWVAATVGAESAAGYELAADDPVMAIGGFNGSDPTPTLAQFERYVAAGDIHYFIAGGGGGGAPTAGSAGGPTAGSAGGGGGGGGGATGGPAVSAESSAITSWVESHFTGKTVDGVTIYDLSQG